MKSATDGNIGVSRGAWGELVAVNYFRNHGFDIIDRNVRPVEKDRRLEIDIVAFERSSETIVFVEVKQHASLSPYGRRLRSIDKAKKANLRRACRSWCRVNEWPGGYRLDVLEVYGIPEGGLPVVDHVIGVDAFARPDRFVRWS